MATALVATQPIWQALITVAQGQHLPRRIWMGLTVSVLGVAIASGIDVQAGGKALLGDSLALVGAVSQAGYTALSERAREGLSAPLYSALSSSVSALGLLFTCLVIGTPLMHFDDSTALALLGLILLPQLLGLGSLNFALGRGSATTTSVLLLLEGPVAAAVAWLWMGQAPALSALPGLLLIIVGAAVVMSSGIAEDEAFADQPPGQRSSGAWSHVGIDVGRTVGRMPTAEFRILPQHAAPAKNRSSSQAVPVWAEGTARAVPDTAPLPAKAPRGNEHRGVLIAAAALVLVAGAVTGQLVRPAPKPTMRLTLPARHTFQGTVPAMPWPAQGQAALYVEGLGSLGSSGGAAPVPIAGVAKVMTAYVLLRDHALQRGAQGPSFAISPQEASRLPLRRSRGDSVVEVAAGQWFTERKALEALLIVSADNVADELARWDSGGTQAFVRKMNAAARGLGLNATTYADPTGHDPRTVSTAADQVTLLRAAMRIPAFAEITGNRAYAPGDGRPERPGQNLLLGHDGVVGGKSGYTDAAGGNVVFAARRRTGNATTVVVGAALRQRPGTPAAFTAARELIVSAGNALTAVTLAPAGSPVAELDDGFGGRTTLKAAAPVAAAGWPGLTVQVRLTGDPPRSAGTGARAGSVTAGAVRTPLVLGGPLRGPSITERLLRLW
jgi:D-alanyl-D-alanine carboxypeptidase